MSERIAKEIAAIKAALAKLAKMEFTTIASLTALGYAPQRADKTVLYGSGASGQVAAGGTAYLGAREGFISAEVDTGIPAPYAMTLKNLLIRTRSAQPATGTLVFTVTANGVDTGIVITVSAGASAGLVSNTANTASVSALQRVAVKAVNNASSDGAQTASWSIEADAQ